MSKKKAKSKAEPSATPSGSAQAEASTQKPARPRGKKKTAPKQTAKRTAKRKAAPKRTAKSRKATPNPDLCPTTGALRGAVWEPRYARAVETALLEGTPLTLALVDVDGFSRHQSELETERADALLKGLIARLNDALGGLGLAASEWSLGRLAGDLFGLVLARELEEALGLLTLARSQVQRTPIKVGRGVRRREVSPTLSAGLASLRREGTRAEELLTAAQGALWRAKSLGGDRLGIPDSERMTLKSSYYPQTQLDQLKALAKRAGIKESVLLREALGDLFLKYKGRRPQTPIG